MFQVSGKRLLELAFLVFDLRPETWDLRPSLRGLRLVVFLFHFHEVLAEGDGVLFHLLRRALGVAGDDGFHGGVVETRGVKLLRVRFDGLDDLLREPHDTGDEGLEEPVPAHFGKDVVDGGLSVDLFGNGRAGGLFRLEGSPEAPGVFVVYPERGSRPPRVLWGGRGEMDG